MKRVKRTIASVLLCASIIMTLANMMPNAVAATIGELPPAQENGTVSPRTEETTWYFRVYYGKLQKRLWSNTRCIWLTDWIDCP